MNHKADVLIIGAGAAGLAAARELSLANLKVIVLEARDRIGGRIHTHRDGDSLVEMGAEFVHGRPPELLKIVHRSHIKLSEVQNRHWYFRDGKVATSAEFWSKLEAVFNQMKTVKHDESFAQFVEKHASNLGDAKPLATLFIEGFHASKAERVSVFGLNQTNEASEQINDDKQFRIPVGYDLLAQSLHDDAVARGAEFHLRRIVHEINWHRHHVEIAVQSNDGHQDYTAARALITLPLGVLQLSANEIGSVRFVPALVEKQAAAGKLEMGDAIRIVMRFREAFWESVKLPTKDGRARELDELSFIHAPNQQLPTWWTLLPRRTSMLIGWAGGSRADKIEREGVVLKRALESLSTIFAVPQNNIERLLERFYFHDWRADPFSRGAYSYTPLGGLGAQRELAETVAETLFFAGEATNTEGHHGTVHGAIDTGLRAAREIMEIHEAHRQA